MHLDILATFVSGSFPLSLSLLVPSQQTINRRRDIAKEPETYGGKPVVISDPTLSRTKPENSCFVLTD
jgi:hypothetical protein